MTERPSSPGTVYLRGLNWIGDAVLSLGALQGLKKARPGIHVTVGAPPATAGVYRLSDAVDAVIVPPPLLSGVRFDAAVILPRSFRSAWESVFLSESRIGFASEREDGVPDPVEPPEIDGSRGRWPLSHE